MNEQTTTSGAESQNTQSQTSQSKHEPKNVAPYSPVEAEPLTVTLRELIEAEDDAHKEETLSALHAAVENTAESRTRGKKRAALRRVLNVDRLANSSAVRWLKTHVPLEKIEEKMPQRLRRLAQLGKRAFAK